MQKSDYLMDFEEHLAMLSSEGFNLDDERFKHVKGLSMLHMHMHMHDAIKSMLLIKNCSKYESEGSSEEHLLQQALFRNAVLNYAKCFSQSGKGRVTLNKNDIFKDANNLIEFHDQLMNFRNKFFAHSDDSGLDYVSLATKDEDNHIVVKQLYTIVVPQNEFPTYISLFKFCGDRVAEKIQKCFSNLEKKYGKKIFGFGQR